MTLETERQKDRGSANDLGFIQLAQPPRHPKSRRATLKSLSPSDSIHSFHNQQQSDSIHSFHNQQQSDSIHSFHNQQQSDSRHSFHNQSLSTRVLRKCSLSSLASIESAKKDEKSRPAFLSSPIASFRRKSTASPILCHDRVSVTSSPQSFHFRDSNPKLSLGDASESLLDDVFDKKTVADKPTLGKEKKDKDVLLNLFLRSTQNSHSETGARKELSRNGQSSTKVFQASKLKLKKHVKALDNQIIPAIPPPPEAPRGRSPSRVPPHESVDLMDLSSEDDKSTNSSTQTLSTLPSVVSPTIASLSASDPPLISPDSTPSPSTLISPPPTFQSNSSASSASQSSSNAVPPTPMTPSPKLLQARMSLTGLSPPHLMTSEEFSKNASLPPYTSLTTPDLKIDLLESDGRRQSMSERFSPPLLPQGFPFITPDDLTPEELHEFDMKWGSPHHAKGRTGMTRPTLLTLPTNRPRVTSLPNRKEDRDDEEDEYYRLRHFSITGRGVVNRGDSFKSRRSKSNNSVASDVSSNEGWAWSHPGSAANSAASSAASSRASSASEGAFPFRVVMLGAAGVGKTTICHQFMSSEHINGYDSSLDDEYGEKSVSIMLDSEESEIQLIDHPADEMSVENYLATYNPHAIIVVFSVTDRQSFVRAEEIVQYLWRLDVMSHKGVILVANKTDLVRNRCITVKESSNLADSYDCKFIETSSGLNHRVDELLVGVVKQIRLKIHNPDLSREVFRKRSCRRKKYRGTKTSASLKVKSLLTKVCGKEIKSKSCENLHVL